MLRSFSVFWPVIDSIRKRLGRRVDRVVGRRIEQSHFSPHAVRPQTRVVVANPGIASGPGSGHLGRLERQILRHVHRLERRIGDVNHYLEQGIHKLEKQLRYYLAAVLLQTAVIVAVCLAAYWYISHH